MCIHIGAQFGQQSTVGLELGQYANILLEARQTGSRLPGEYANRSLTFITRELAIHRATYSLNRKRFINTAIDIDSL